MTRDCLIRFVACVSVLCCIPELSADWVTFTDETSTRLVAAPAVGEADGEERMYAWGDLNNNGWIDLVAMRKQPGTTHGKRRNVLFMNEEGTLVDRSAEYASASDIPGDEGFLTPTNDRECAIVDVDNNGWLDIATAVTLSDGSPKHISHPRIYKNHGEERGQWQGFIYEEARIPQLEGIVKEGPHKGFPHAPRFNSVGAGDVTGDGYADLYFGDSNGPGGQQTLDFNDRLLINGGSGFYADESFRIPSNWLSSPATNAAVIEDFNLDGMREIVRNRALGAFDVRVFYGDPKNPGFFTSNQFVSGSSPTHVAAGDLNNNGRLDLAISRNGVDAVLYNLGNDKDDLVDWSDVVTLPDSLGFRSDVVLADLNNNGWLDILIASIEFDLPHNCPSYGRMYRNKADVPMPTFEMSHGNLEPNDFQDAFYIAAFDITGNGWNDLVVATGCEGTNTYGTTVFINLAVDTCPADLNGDNVVNVLDLLVLLEAWGECDNQNDCPADLNNDGEVNVLDLLILLEAWGPCP